MQFVKFRVTSLGLIINSSLALFIPIIIKASTIGQNKGRKAQGRIDNLNLNLQCVCRSSAGQCLHELVPMMMINILNILKRPFRSFYPKVQHKYSQKHYHKILICKYLTQNMYLKHYLKKTQESRVICCIIVHYSTVVPHNFSYIYILENWKNPGISYLEKSGNPVLKFYIFRSTQ